MRTSLHLTLFVLLGSRAVLSMPKDFVDLNTFDFSIKLDLWSATASNPLGKPLYPQSKCFLRKSVAEALSRVQASLKIQGYGLKVNDCYRPLSLQQKLKSVRGERAWVDKESKHCRGSAVDVELVGRDGELPRVDSKNRARLAKAMQQEGFVSSDFRHMHFDHRDWQKYAEEDISFEAFRN